MANHDPEAARFVTEDLQRFWAVFPHLDAPDAAKRFEHEYIQAGTSGLREFLDLEIETVDLLVQKVRTCRAYYASLQPASTALVRELPACRASFRRLAELYPGAVFPDTTFVIGRMNCGGTVGASGLLIGTEIFSRAPDSPLHELNAWERAVILPISDLPFIVAHELIHLQQPAETQRTLLAKVLREGAAEVLGERLSGRVCTPAVHAYGRRHEQDLWHRIQHDLPGEDLSGWLYQGNRSRDEPADLGYFVGAQLCRAYLKQHGDGPEAVRGVIERAVLDPEGFLQGSGYDGTSAAR